MKIQITIDYEVDGPQPSIEDIYTLLSKRVIGLLASEEVDPNDDSWAMYPENICVEEITE